MTHQVAIETGGKALAEAEKALILLHGRGGSAADILGMASYLNVRDYALCAPQATNRTWYPHSFMAPVRQNEPWLSSAIDVVGSTVQQVVEAGIKPGNIYFFGFSQGACLTLEYLARNAQRYGGAVAIIGGVIGEQIDRTHYQGDFRQTPVLLGTSDPDAHVPVGRVHESTAILTEMNAAVTLEICENFGHAIHPVQIDRANQLIFK